jgi:hypothetical protein
VASVTPNEILVIVKLLSALAAATPANAATAQPQQSASIDLRESIADTADAVIRCYHPTGRLQLASVVQAPWAYQGQWNADKSAVLQIRWRGMVNSYISTVVILERNNKVHAVLLRDAAMVPANRRCALDGWVDAKE